MCIILTKTIQFLISIISLNLPFRTTHFRTPLSNLFFACFRFPSLPKWLSRQLWSLSANSSLPFALELPSFRILSCSRSSPYFLQFCCPANRLILAFPFMLMAVNEMIPSGQHTKGQQQSSWICFHPAIKCTTDIIFFAIIVIYNLVGSEYIVYPIWKSYRISL